MKIKPFCSGTTVVACWFYFITVELMCKLLRELEQR